MKEDKEDIIVDIRNISKTFPGVNALSDVSFQIQKGHIHALVGENGAGKSTLIKILSGEYQADSGDFCLRGNKVKVSSPYEAQKLGISVVHQELKLSETLTVAENIFLGRPFINRFHVVDWKKMKEEAEKILRSLDIEMDVNEEVSRLSIAQKQIVEICKALSFHADFIIMDEPSATLTDKELQSLYRILNILKQQNVTILYISHRMEEIFDVADEVTVLRDGQHIKTLPVSEVNRELLISLMVGRKMGEEYPKLKADIGCIALEVTDLSTSTKLKHVSFNVRHGEIIGLAGLVGAGRTETARAVFGADKKNSGEIKIDGRRVKINSVMDAVRNKISLVPEDRKAQGLILIHSVRNNIAMVDLNNISKNGLLNTEKENALAKKYTDLLNIVTPTVKRETRFLSGGNQQKVVLAKWLVVDSEILFFDEPTRGIDVLAKSEIYRLMGELAQQGKAIIMISSDMSELIGICDRIYVMREGSISKELQRENFTQERIMTYAVN